MVQPVKRFQRIVKRFDTDIIFGLLDYFCQYGAPGRFVVDD